MNARVSVCCGNPDGINRFEDRTFDVPHQFSSRDVPGLSGWECMKCSNVEFDDDSASRYAKASDQLVEDANLVVAEKKNRLFG